MDYIINAQDAQVLVSADGEVVALEDRRYDWKERRERNMKLYELYEKAGYPDYAVRAKDCATFLEFATPDGGERKLRTANFCKMRLCPMCIGRRARKSAWKLSKVLDLVEAEHEVKFIFLTLTMRNVVDGKYLGAALGELTDAWDRFLKLRPIVRSVRGYFRAIEITRGNGITKEDKGYHPHIHVILAVDRDYFSKASRKSGKYLNQSDLVLFWQKALRVDYLPSVDISTTKAKRKRGGVESASLAAAKEGAKYPVKDDDYIDPKLPEDRAIEILRDYTEALRKRRLIAFGGWMKEAAKKLDAEDLEGGDLVHVDEDDVIREDVKLLIERFCWHFGAGDYILSGREISVPLSDRKGSGTKYLKEQKEKLRESGKELPNGRQWSEEWAKVQSEKNARGGQAG
ncbi:MAG: protein rep [Oscillospiraceae bacterium]|nr:protein rep [Oscillospiraceae bacterium]